MNPTFSVIFFTTLSGAGYGLWFWFAFSDYLPALSQNDDVTFPAWAGVFVLGFVLVTIGLLASVFHLGKPQRLSREGIASLLTYASAGAFFLSVRFGLQSIAIAIMAACSMATVFCTGMIYASLKPIPAWRHHLVVPVYLAFALQTGGLLDLAEFLDEGAFTSQPLIAFAIACSLTIAIAVLKCIYWRDIDRIELPSRESATALEGIGTVTTFERPHTEANYLTREMGFVLARKHSRKLRIIAMLLFAGIPLLALSIAWLIPAAAVFALWVAALAALAGAFVERWLFFAEAKHMVTLYY
jgi:DMSO reductase anchor subunit